MRKVLLVLLLCGVAIGQEVPQGDPKIKAGTFTGKASFVPWSGDWWNMADGYLGVGWNGQKTFTYDTATKKYKFNPAVATNDLSPLAKYDKAVGNSLDNGAAAWELTDTGYWRHHIFGATKEKYDKDEVDYSWWGHCNGWAAAAALEAEPIAPIEKNGVRFEVADIKGLLTESHYGVVSPFSGTRYNAPEKEQKANYTKAQDLLKKLKAGTPAPVAEYRAWYEKAYGTTLNQNYTPSWYKSALENYIKNYDDEFTKAFEDIRPDVFHKILVSVIGEMKSVVVFDITASEAVWNYPAFSYQTKLTDKGTRKIDGYNRRVFSVTTKVVYADDGVDYSILGTNTFTKTYKYELYTTTSSRKLRGGKWLGSSVDDHPDFAWFPKFNPTGVDYEENKKLIWGKVLDFLPKFHSATETQSFQLFANGTGSDSRRTDKSPVTWMRPVTGGTSITLSYQSSSSNVAKVKYFEQKVESIDSDNAKATRDPLVALGEGASVTATFASGKHMIVAYAYDAADTLLAIDEITVKVQ